MFGFPEKHEENRQGMVISAKVIGRGRDRARSWPKALMSDHHVTAGSHAPFNEARSLFITANPLAKNEHLMREGRWEVIGVRIW